jgi:class 3 adenylate cyclase
VSVSAAGGEHPPGSSEAAHDIEKRFASLPRWRRPRRLRRQLAAALVVTALLAVATFGAVNFVAARELLVRNTENQLAAVGTTRSASIQAGTERLIDEVSVAASDVAVAGVLEDLAREFAELDDLSLTPQERAELDGYYEQRVVAALDEAGVGPVTASELVPSRAAAQWVQYHYTVRPPGEPPPVDAGDATGYSEVNASVNDAVRAFSDSKAGGDVLLIDDTGTIVYTLDKGNDVGTSLVSGPYSQGALAQVVSTGLPRARVGSTLLTDFSISANGRPALYAVSPLSNGAKVVGGLALEIPVEALNSVTSADGEWEAVGLGEGDTYIVDAAGRLQSEPRAWTDDPDAYLDRLRRGDESDQAEAQIIDVVGSPVGVQVIDTAPVRAAIDGEQFRGPARDYFGDSTFAAAESFSASGRQWVVVTEVPRSVALQPLLRYLLQIAIVLAIVLPVVAALGAWMARLLTRPIRPTVEAAEGIAQGDRDPDIDTARGDEFGDLARRLSAMADALDEQESELTAEYERTRQLLLAVLPRALVDDGGAIVGSGERTRRATVVAVTLAPSQAHDDPELLGQALQRSAELAETLAERTGLERVRVAADRYLFLAEDDVGAGGADALTFATDLRLGLDSDSDGIDVDLDMHVGMASGSVATGVLDTGSLTFGAWGDPVRRALALASLSKVDSVLVDPTTADESTQRQWHLEPAQGVVALDGEPADLYTLDLSSASGRIQTRR